MNIEKRWTIDERMRLPDWCFGNRHMIGVYRSNFVPGTFNWGISELPFPDPACIWAANIISTPTNTGQGSVRIGLGNILPTSTVEMDAAVEIFPNFGIPRAGPNQIPFYGVSTIQYQIFVRKGMVTAAKKLIIESYCHAGDVRFEVVLIVSGLPTNISGWLAHSFETEVR